LKENRTINGMFYILRTDILKKYNAFEEIKYWLCDDLALATYLLSKNVRIIQSTIFCNVRNTVPDLKKYILLMKRWLLFGNVYMKNVFSVNFLFMILLPTILPTMLLFLSFYLGINYLLTVFYLFISKVVLFYVIRLSIYRVKREEKEKKSEKTVFMTLLFQITQLLYELISEFMLPFMLSIEGQRYEYEMNMLLQACKAYPIVEVPIETVYINDNKTSHFRPIQDGLMIYKDMFKFALSSLSSFIVDYLVYAVALLFLVAVPTTLRILLANGIARVTSSIFNYSANKKLVFKNEDSIAKTGSGYFGLALGLFILDTLLIRLFYAVFGINLLLVKILVGILLFSLSWLIQKKFIFKERTHTVS